jgi:hypothetical protein
MNFKQLDRGELIAVVGGLLLAISLFLTWYKTGNKNSVLSSCVGAHKSCSGWDALTNLRYLLLAAALAPAILAYIVATGAALSWPRGELTAVVALAALALTIFRGLISKPGSPSGEISVAYGWWVALLGGVLILVGSVARTRESAARRKPPGVL